MGNSFTPYSKKSITYLKDIKYKAFGQAKIYDVMGLNMKVVEIHCSLQLKNPVQRTRIRHPNFLGALAWENEESDSELKTVFFFELVEISLEQIIEQRLSKKLFFPENDILRIATNVITALEHLHKGDIYIGNIEPCTLFHDKKQNLIKMYDSVLILGQHPSYRKLEQYIYSSGKYPFPVISPETLESFKHQNISNLEKFRFQSDIYCLGMTLLMICSLTSDFSIFVDEKNLRFKQSSISQKLEELNGNYSLCTINFLKSMLTDNPQYRPSAQQLLSILQTQDQQTIIQNNPSPFRISQFPKCQLIEQKNTDISLCNFDNNFKNFSTRLQTPNSSPTKASSLRTPQTPYLQFTPQQQQSNQQIGNYHSYINESHFPRKELPTFSNNTSFINSHKTPQQLDQINISSFNVVQQPQRNNSPSPFFLPLTNQNNITTSTFQPSQARYNISPVRSASPIISTPQKVVYSTMPIPRSFTPNQFQFQIRQSPSKQIELERVNSLNQFKNTPTSLQVMNKSQNMIPVAHISYITENIPRQTQSPPQYSFNQYNTQIRSPLQKKQFFNFSQREDEKRVNISQRRNNHKENVLDLRSYKQMPINYLDNQAKKEDRFSPLPLSDRINNCFQKGMVNTPPFSHPNYFFSSPQKIQLQQQPQSFAFPKYPFSKISQSPKLPNMQPSLLRDTSFKSVISQNRSISPNNYDSNSLNKPQFIDYNSIQISPTPKVINAPKILPSYLFGNFQSPNQNYSLSPPPSSNHLPQNNEKISPFKITPKNPPNYPSQNKAMQANNNSSNNKNNNNNNNNNRNQDLSPLKKEQNSSNKIFRKKNTIPSVIQEESDYIEDTHNTLNQLNLGQLITNQEKIDQAILKYSFHETDQSPMSQRDKPKSALHFNQEIPFKERKQLKYQF